MKTAQQCKFEITDKSLNVMHHTSIKDVMCLGTMLRNELLPILGMEQTVKWSQLSKSFNLVIDYNHFEENEKS